MNVLPVRQNTTAHGSASRWWESFFDASEDAQIVCRSDGIVEQINPKAARQFGLHPESQAGTLSIFRIVSSPADRKLERALRFDYPRTHIIHSVTVLKDGRPHSLADVIAVRLSESHTLVTFKDASHRLRIESHIQRLVTAVDATPDVFIIVDAELRITFVNPAFQSVTGYGIEEVLGRPDDFLRAPFEGEKVQAYIDAVTQGQEWIGEFVNVRRNGETYHVESIISPIADAAGRFVGYVACERDVTARKHLQDELRIQRDFVQSILHSLDGAIYSMDCEFRITHTNDGWRHIPGEHGGVLMAGAPAIGSCLLDRVEDAARRAELRTLFQRVIDTTDGEENVYHAPDGRHWLVKISPQMDGRQVRGLTCSIADQTHFYDLQDQLFQAQKMEIIGTLAAGVAHDFNNLLQAIRGHTSLILMKAPREAPFRSGLEKIDIAAVRAANITKQLLSFSRRSEEKRTVLDLNDVIQEASQLARRTLRGNVTVELHPTPKPVPVKIDFTRASQALLNLCVNAQDAMPNGGKLSLTNTFVEIPPDLAARRCLEPGAIYARCSVADTGCGIPPEVLSRIFQPFFTTKEKGKGTGLGLSIVQRVAQEANGFVDVESTLGSGTTFHFYLPLAQEQLTPVSAKEQSPLPHGKGRILVVDDVDLLRDFAHSFLEIAGLTVLVSNGGEHALKVLQDAREPIDLVFTDYNMPGMNGIELIEKVAERWPQTRFVLASGYLDDTVRARVERCNASILHKPYEMRDAAEMILKKLE